jgi:hypothetical protein
MALVVEEGLGEPLANTYMLQVDFELYAETLNWDISAYSDEQIESALIQGTRAIDNWVKYPGVKTWGSEQGLFWPRKAGWIEYGVFVNDPYMTNITDAEGLIIDVDEIPRPILQATAEAAYRELQNPGSMQPDMERQVKSLKAGSVSIEYEGGGTGATNYTIIDNLVAQVAGQEAVGGTAMVDLLRA